MTDMFEIVGTPERPELLDLAVSIGLRMIVVHQNIWLVEFGNVEPVSLRCEPIGALPAINSSEHGTELLLAIIGRRTL